MITFNKLSPAQSKWLSLLEILFPDIYKNDTITHNQLKMVHDHLVSLREKDKKYKVSWPIWLISNNAIDRGVYTIPKETEEIQTQDDPDIDHQFYPEYAFELMKFGIEVE